MIYFHVYHETRDETRDSGLYNVRIFYHQCLFVVVYRSMQLLTLPRIRHICLLFWGDEFKSNWHFQNKLSVYRFLFSSPLSFVSLSKRLSSHPVHPILCFLLSPSVPYIIILPLSPNDAFTLSHFAFTRQALKPFSSCFVLLVSLLLSSFILLSYFFFSLYIFFLYIYSTLSFIFIVVVAIVNSRFSLSLFLSFFHIYFILRSPFLFPLFNSFPFPNHFLTIFINLFLPNYFGFSLNSPSPYSVSVWLTKQERMQINEIIRIKYINAKKGHRTGGEIFKEKIIMQ